MCATCGCSSAVAGVGLPGVHDHGHSHDHEPGHAHDRGHEHEGGHGHSHDDGHLHQSVTPDSRTVSLERAVLAKNDQNAARNRERFAAQGVLALNVMSSPGSGKTTLLERTIRELSTELPMVVIEGDQATENDSARIRAAGARALQINTGTGCHLEAESVGRALDVLTPQRDSVVIVENVGNLVCPALFDLGEHAKVAILSVTEGDDKPAKYPYMFAVADLLIVNKIDLLPYVDFNVERCIASARSVRPQLEAIALSARSGEGIEAWYAWIRAALARTRASHSSPASV